MPTWGKMFFLGILINVGPLAALWVIGHFLDLYQYVFIALGMQWAVFLFHGFPFQSEKFYDISGSLTHFSVVLASLISSSATKSPR
jgi:hypothetical protein